jgi:hypothetical protein
VNKEHLRYHRHLGQIADADLNYIKRKDCQYDASWKKRGGVGAWFTIARPMDRLVNFVESGDHQYDLFAKIGAEGLAGPDGSVIACVRDLRRYLLLVEAEMTQRLEAPSDGRIYSDVSKGLCGLDFEEAEKRIMAWANSASEDDTMYEKAAREMGITVREAKLRIFKSLYGGGEWPKGYEGGDFETGGPVEPAVAVTNTPRPGESEEQTLSRSVEGRAELARRRDEPEAKGPLSWNQSERRVPRYPDEPVTLPERAEPSGTWPWIASWIVVSSLGQRVAEAWHRGGTDTMTLEPRLTAELWSIIPPEARDCYSPLVPGGQADPVYWLRVWEAPSDERERWPSLAPELNHAEWQGAMEYAELYEWHEGPGKYILRPEWMGWRAEAQ